MARLLVRAPSHCEGDARGSGAEFGLRDSHAHRRRNIKGDLTNLTGERERPVKKPDKYKREVDSYEKAFRIYVKAHPDSVNGIDAELGDTNPIRRWSQMQLDQKREVEQRVEVLAETQYLVARTVSDLDGRGVFSGVAPGRYWITTLDVPALAGDVHVEWNSSVTIRAGQLRMLNSLI